MLKIRNFIAVLTVIALMSSMLLVGCSSSNSRGMLLKENVLTVGSDCDYPPFIYMEGNQAAGFEYELLDAVAKDMGLTLEYIEPQDFATLPTQVAGGNKMDLACSSITITPEREAVIDFTNPYFEANQACIVNKSSGYTSLSDLEGKKIGAQTGTTGYSWASEHIGAIEIQGCGQISEGLQSLQAGNIEALILDAPIAEYHTQNNFKEMKLISVIPTGEQYGFAVSKDNPALKAAVNKSLRNIIDNGTYEKIFKKHFPSLEVPAL